MLLDSDLKGLGLLIKFLVDQVSFDDGLQFVLEFLDEANSEHFDLRVEADEQLLENLV